MQGLFDAKPERPPKITRRAFLRGAAGVAVAGAVGVGGPSSVDYTEEKIRPEALKNEIKRKVEYIRSKYGISINGTFLESKSLSGIRKLVDQFMEVEYEEASMVKTNRALDYLVQEFSKYPTSFIQNLHIPSIHIIDSLVSRGNPTATGTTATKESGLENYINLEISSGVLNKDKSFGWSEKGPFKETLHHEIFHVIYDLADNSSRHIFSRNWVSLYDAEDYGETKPHEERSGFISTYGQESSDEDFSDTASAMMNNSENIFDKINKDPKLKRKVDFLKKLMFYRSFGLCNREYWDLLRKGNVSPDFFNKRRAYLLSLNLEQFNNELELNNFKKIDIFTFGEKELLTDEGVFELYRKRLTEMKI